MEQLTKKMEIIGVSKTFFGEKDYFTTLDNVTFDVRQGEIVGLLQSPARNVISALQSGGGKLAGIVKTLSERE